ncbi:hypothetical protein A2U01_0062107, partial [Trifolium medium]|nr:hypothetical protein [Trifolium medium]
FWLLRHAQPVLRRTQCLCCVGCFLLLAARRAGVTCAARKAALLGLGVFWFLRCAQVCAALRAGLVVEG